MTAVLTLEQGSSALVHETHLTYLQGNNLGYKRGTEKYNTLANSGSLGRSSDRLYSASECYLDCFGYCESDVWPALRMYCNLMGPFGWLGGGVGIGLGIIGKAKGVAQALSIVGFLAVAPCIYQVPCLLACLDNGTGMYLAYGFCPDF